ncbi:hypothetical protein [Novosphingobium sp. HII-3]|uniref:hypothetical protein n=1 Tax=Novosphingobium sp. HII-3 TaxID=2075565 RepID=UPI000CDA0394|nr:hypothetical protein [Novosphingobium sp. HII-3]
MPNFTKATTDRGPVFGVDGAHVFIDQSDDIMARAIPVLDSATEAAQAAAATYLPDALAPALARVLAPVLGAAGGMIDAARRDAQEHAERAVFMTTPVSATAEKAERFGTEIRALSRAAKPADREVKVRTASATEAAALLALPEAAGLTSDQVETLRERAMVVHHIERAGLTAGRGIRPTAERLTGVGVDQAAVEADAQAAVDQFYAKGALIDEREGQLQNLVRWIGAGLGVPATAALDMVLDA